MPNKESTQDSFSLDAIAAVAEPTRSHSKPSQMGYEEPLAVEHRRADYRLPGD